jgi:hypothetical protein
VISGVEEEYYALDQPVSLTGNCHGESRIWAERLNTRGDKTTVIARYMHQTAVG